jgi:type II secretion system (T2SS) protein E
MSDAVIEHTNETGLRTALGTLLIEAGLLDSGRLEEALRIGADTGERLGEVVVRMGWATEDDLAKTLADQWQLRYLERSAISFDANALSRMSREEASRLEALPMKVSEDGSVVVALAEPTDARLLALRSLLGDRIDCVVVAKTAIDAGLRSDLLAKRETGTTPNTDEPVDEAGPNENGLALVASEADDHDATTPETAETETDEHAGSSESAEAAAEVVGAANFDEVATTLTDALGAQLASLRGIVVEAETRRERDGKEIARLEAEVANLSTDLADRVGELAQKAAELTDRNETIRDMQQKLRELADTLEHKA